MVTDTDFLDAHFATGVGQYDALWDKIEAEWYMAAEGGRKTDLGDDGFQVVFSKPGAFLCFPNMENMPAHSKLVLRVASERETTLQIRENAVGGPLLGTCVIPATGATQQNKDPACSLNNSAGKKTLYFVLTGGGMNLDQFFLAGE